MPLIFFHISPHCLFKHFFCISTVFHAGLFILKKLACPSSHQPAILYLSQAGHFLFEVAKILKINCKVVHWTLKCGKFNDLNYSGHLVSVVTSHFKKNVRKKIQCQPWKSIRRLALELNVLATTVRRAVRKDFKICPYKNQRRHGLTEMQRKGR